MRGAVASCQRVILEFEADHGTRGHLPRMSFSYPPPAWLEKAGVKPPFDQLPEKTKNHVFSSAIPSVQNRGFFLRSLGQHVQDPRYVSLKRTLFLVTVRFC